MAGYKQNNQLNEKDSLQDMLELEKSVVKMYVTAVTEAANKPVRSAIKSLLTESADDQYEIFKLMRDNGYYEPAPADKAVIDRDKDTFKKAQTELKKAAGQ